MIFIPILLVLGFTTIFFSGDPTWVYTTSEIFILGFSLGFFLISIFRSNLTDKAWFKIDRNPITIFGFFFLCLIFFQLIPWPTYLANILSSSSLEIWKRAPLRVGSYYPISLYPYVTEQGLIFAFCLLLVFWWVFYGITNRQNMEKLVISLLFFGALMALYGLTETSTGHNQILWLKKSYGQGSVTATFFNRNHLAAFLSMNLLMGVGYFWSLWQKTQKDLERSRGGRSIQIEERLKALGLKGLLTGLSLLILVFTLLTTASRGGNLSALAGLVLMAGLILSRSATKKGLVSFSMLIVVIVALGSFWAGDQLWERLKYEPLEKIEAESDLNRPALNRDTWAMLKDYPIFGSGFNTYQHAFTRYGVHSLPYVDHAHNDWLELAAETGWVGLIIILSGLIFTAFQLYRAIVKISDPFRQGLGMGGLAVLLAISLHSLVDFSLHKPANTILLAIILGLACSAVLRGGESSVEADLETPLPRRSSSGRNAQEGGGGKSKASFFITGKRPVLPIIVGFLGLAAFLWIVNPVLRALISDLSIPAELDETRQHPKLDLEQIIRNIEINPDSSTEWARLANTLQEEEITLPDSYFNQIEKLGKSRWSNEKPPIPNQQYRQLFPVMESLARRPVYAPYWYRLITGSADYIKENPSFYLPLIAKAYDNVLYLNPQLAVGYMERGIFYLQYSQQMSAKDRRDYTGDLEKSLEMDPELSTRMIEEFMDRSLSIQIVANILPKEKPLAWIRAGETLLERGQTIQGEALYLKGEALKAAETEAFSGRLKKALQDKERLQIEKLRTELVKLDPDNPWVYYSRGDILKACSEALKRGWPLSRLDDITRLRSILAQLNPANEDDRFRGRYYLALLDLEGKNYKEAARRIDLLLDEKPNFYPALLARLQILNKKNQTTEEKILQEKIQKRIALFSMEEIPAGAWAATGSKDEDKQKSFRAVLRNEKPLTELKLSTPAEANRLLIFVGDRFVGVREPAEKTLKISLPAPLFPGEHQVAMRYIQDFPIKEMPLANKKQ
jgi:O-antigen ligase